MTDNVEQLKQLRTEHNLKNKDIAELIGVSHRTVVSWLSIPSSTNYRTMGDDRIPTLIAKLAEIEAEKEEK